MGHQLVTSRCLEQGAIRSLHASAATASIDHRRRGRVEHLQEIGSRVECEPRPVLRRACGMSVFKARDEHGDALLVISGPNMIGLYKDLLHKWYMSQARTGLMHYIGPNGAVFRAPVILVHWMVFRTGFPFHGL